MNRQNFIVNSAAAVVMRTEGIWARSTNVAPWQALTPGVDESFDGKPANLARIGEFQSWINPEATAALQRGFARGQSTKSPLRIAALPGKGPESDIGVEWPEFRTVNKVTVRFPAQEKEPPKGTLFLESWDGTTALQGRSWPVGRTPTIRIEEKQVAQLFFIMQKLCS
jgi:hypothetical protein